MEPTSQISEALSLIENLHDTARAVWVNRNQCVRVADRFDDIGKTLKPFERDLYGDNLLNDSKRVCPAVEELLTVIKKGHALVSHYKDWSGIISAFSRQDNREAFKEIHEDLDNLKATFPFEGLSRDIEFEMTTGGERDKILTADAEKDRKAIPEKLEALTRIDEDHLTTGKPATMDLEKLRIVVLEKCDPAGANADLPSYLRIDPATMETKDPVREYVRLSDQDNVEFDGWACVHSGRWLGCDLAIKVFRSGFYDWNKDQLAKEVGFLMNLRHPHIVQLIGFAQDAQRCCILMELMDTDLRHFMKMKTTPGRPFTRSQELDIITQIAKGMYYLHTQGYVHGELKCSNVLVKKLGDYVEAKISDFRSSQELGILKNATSRSLNKQTSTSVRPRWTAPEALTKYDGCEPTDTHLQKGDVYSFGMSCYEVVTGKLPFQDVRGHELWKQIQAGVRPELPGDLDDDLRGLIQKCWDPKPEERPGFEEICYLLEYIKAMKPALMETSSGKDKVWTVFKRISQIQGPFLGLFDKVRGKDQPSDQQTSTWNMEEDERVHSDSTSTSTISIPKCLQIAPTDLKKVRRVGKGGFAKVYEAKWLGCRFAVKRFRSTIPIPDLQNELDFLIKLHHPHIVRLVGFSVDSSQRCSIVMEFMDKNLRELIASRRCKKILENKSQSIPVAPFDQHEALDIITKIALGMAFLHSRGVMHRDLKAANVLVHEHSGSLIVKIVDFGVSQHVGSDIPSTVIGVGTGFWRAPELLPCPQNFVAMESSRTPNLEAADVYSFAMTCSEVLTGEVPLQGQIGQTDYAAVISGRRPTLPVDVIPELKVLIEKCWRQDPEERPNFSYILDQLHRISNLN